MNSDNLRFVSLDNPEELERWKQQMCDALETLQRTADARCDRLKESAEHMSAVATDSLNRVKDQLEGLKSDIKVHEAQSKRYEWCLRHPGHAASIFTSWLSDSQFRRAIHPDLAIDDQIAKEEKYGNPG